MTPFRVPRKSPCRKSCSFARFPIQMSEFRCVGLAGLIRLGEGIHQDIPEEVREPDEPLEGRFQTPLELVAIVIDPPAVHVVEQEADGSSHALPVAELFVSLLARL